MCDVKIFICCIHICVFTVDLLVSPSLVAQMVKNLPAMGETQVWSPGWKIPWRREWLPTSVFLPREFHGQRSLVGYNPRDRRVKYDWATNTFTFLVSDHVTFFLSRLLDRQQCLGSHIYSHLVLLPLPHKRDDQVYCSLHDPLGRFFPSHCLSRLLPQISTVQTDPFINQSQASLQLVMRDLS